MNPTQTLTKVLAWTALLIFIWPTQYLMVVPIVYLWRWTVAIITGSLKYGLLGIMLLCIPIVGWVVLAYLVFFKRRSPEPPAERLDVLTPWLKSWVLA